MINLRNAGCVSRGAVMSLLTGAMTLGWAVLPQSVAFADNGSITITQKQNADATYDAYRIATGTVTPGTPAKANNLAWASTDIKGVVVPFLNSSSNGADVTYSAWLVSKGLCTADDVTNETDAYKAQRDLAQNAVEYISLKIGSSANANTGQTPDAKTNASFATKLADTIASSTVAKSGTATSGTAYSDVAGYYLFVTTPSTLTTGNTGTHKDVATHPIWTPIADGENVTMQEKAFAPTLSQLVKVDREGDDWHSIVDANKGDSVTYKTTATIPEDLGAYATYPVTVTNTIEPGITPTTTGMKVLIDGVDVTSQVTVGIGDDGKPYVTIADLKVIDLGEGRHPSGGSTIDFLVPATVNENATIGLGDNTNDNVPSLTYPTDDTGTTNASTIDATGTSVATYQINLLKVDKETREALANAKFYVKSGSNYIATDGHIVTDYTGGTEESSLSAAGLLFASGSDGKFPIPRIDEGTYVISEVTPPAGHDRVDTPLTFQLIATKDQQNILVTNLTPTSVSGWLGIATRDATTGVVADNQDGICDFSVNDGWYTVRISNEKEITLPVTGLHPQQLTTIIGAGILLISIFLYLRSRKASGEEEAENKE